MSWSQGTPRRSALRVASGARRRLDPRGRARDTQAPASPSRAEAGPASLARAVELPSGREIYLRCRGAGSPTVVLVSGYHVAANAWSLRPPGSRHTPVLPAVARSTRVCAYDRPGTIRDAGLVSRSDPVPMPRTAEDAVKELHALLRAARVPGPYVLAGHSLGGLIVRLYASTYPRQVAGLVLIDAVSEKLEPLLGPERWATYAGYQFVPVPGFEDYRDAETFDFTASVAQTRRAAAARPLRATLPLVVLSKGQSFGVPDSVLGFPVAALDRAWRIAQRKLARLVPHARHVVAAKSGHDIYLEQPPLVIDAIRRVIREVRRSARLRSG